MSEMVEKVARALCIAAGINPEYWSNPLEVAQARAAIEAMMEPSPEMVDAAWPLPNFDGPIMDHRKSDIKEYWQAMLRSALVNRKE